MKAADSAFSEWFAKADKDLRTAELSLVVEDPMPEIACYHAQQCAEKYLKGYLTCRQISFKFVHELAYLARLCANSDPDFGVLLEPAAQLEDYASDVRYPIHGLAPPTVEEAQQAILRAKTIRSFVLSKMEREDPGPKT